MTDYPLFIALFSVPFLLGRLRTFRKGLVTSLFILLLFLGSGRLLTLSIPFICAIFLFFTERKKAASAKEQSAFVKNPSSFMMTVFLITMTIFCAFGDIFYLYGMFLSLDEKILALGKQCAAFGFLSGCLVLGNRYDRKGPFSAAIFLSLAAELSILFAGAGQSSTLLFVLGNFLLAFSISGFFVLMPLLFCAFYGQKNFLRMYPAAAGSAVLCWGIFRYFYISTWSKSVNPAAFLLNLLFLIIISSFCVFRAWKKRLVLVRQV
ncbi:hypothetical protein AALA24_08955 [Anaerovoracaceae bacterium 42-11]